MFLTNYQTSQVQIGETVDVLQQPRNPIKLIYPALLG